MEEDVGFWSELRGDCSLGGGTGRLETLEEVEEDNLLPVLPWLWVDVCDLRDS